MGEDCAGLLEVEHDDLERHLRDLYTAGASASTLAGVVAAVRGFYDYAAARGLVDENPALRLRGPSLRYQSEAPHLTIPETRRLLFGPSRPGLLPSDPLAARNRVLLAVVYVCGLRVSEPCRLRVEDLAWDESVRPPLWSILIRAGKWADRDHRMPVAQPVVSRMVGAYLEMRAREKAWKGSPWLFASYRGRRLDRSTAAEVFRRAAAAAGIESKGRRLSFHILRHSIATHLFQRGMRDSEVALWLRHRDRRSTERYIHINDRRMLKSWRKRDPLSNRTAAEVPSVHELGRALVGGVADSLVV